MSLRMTPSPAARALFKALGAEEAPPAADELEGFDQAEYSPSADVPRRLGYDMALKKKRQTALLRRMLENAGMTDLARNVNIRQHGGYHALPYREEEDDHGY